MGIFDKMKEPIFLKENSDALRQRDKLKTLEPMLNADGKIKLMQEIKFLEYGIAGENNIAFELKNSHIPMYILHDIYLENSDLSAQIDYMVFTRKLCFIIECKNLIGNIEINHSGDFIRTMEFGGKKKKEGIYSPITQNQRHLELIKKIRLESKSNFLTRFMAERFFEDFYKPIVVLANPKTICNNKFATKDIKNQVIRADQLVNYIKENCKKSKEAEQSDSQLLEWAQSFLNLHTEVEKDYTSKFEPYFSSQCEETSQKPNLEKLSNSSMEEVSASLETDIIEQSELYKALKTYRLNKCREEKIKPYFIYNDNQLKDLISKMPINNDELTCVAGFGEKKAEKYGDDIIPIILKYRKE
jgi:Superfamily II DNA helicase